MDSRKMKTAADRTADGRIKDMWDNPYRKDFPLLMENRTAYLDSAATAQRPQCVIDGEAQFYEKFNANPMRGLYDLSVKATDKYEEARETVRAFINAPDACQVIFTNNTTESLNLVAYSYGLSHIKAGDEIVVTIMEHHSNLLPWQMVAKKTGAVLRFLECAEDGSIPRERMDAVFSERTRLVAVAEVSNVTGRRAPVEEIVRRARDCGAVVVMDAAQSAPHMAIDVQALDVDFAAFSGHKLMAPMGTGVLYGKRELLEGMPPFLTGGEMIDSVTRTGAVFAPLPHKFEAGTVDAGGVWGLKKAIDYVNRVGFDEIDRITRQLTARALEGLKEIPHVRVIGSDKPEEHNGILTFTLDGVHPHDVSAILDSDGIAVRAGHHCAQPFMDYLGVKSTTRASIYFYNTAEEIDRFLESMRTMRRRMGYGE